ncbi:uncharacterized protein LTR77_005789 [Saxophila tyrrhenica]|uniref:alpha-1,2-Mannosidase n=1 Tax=Saxophila tyrrhenica TaxID=1690608 RepID=A0AAV9P9Q2_9PEZI|nr:hypothetical protein LTR77_005789 [Saxophila tyrrhenica]
MFQSIPTTLALLTASALSFAWPPPSWSPHPHGPPPTWQQHGNHHHHDDELAYPRQRGPDYDYTSFTQDQQSRADAIIAQFRFAWSGYYTHAYPHDDLLPKNNSFSDSRNGWGLLMFDALDTAIIMEQKDIVDIILDFIPTVDFSRNNAEPVQEDGVENAVSTSLFETTIRYLGGMLGAYDLLKGPFGHLGVEEGKVDALLSQAGSLADAVKSAFDTPTGIPVNLQHLSDLTGNPEYGDLAQKAESYWFNGDEIWPGLTGGNFSVQTGEIQDQYGGWTSGNDSAYEYLIKMYVYDPERYQNYSERWQAAADSTIAHLIGHPSSRPDLTMAGAFDGNMVENYTEQLACFIGGNFILGATVLDRSDYMDYGLAFSEFCANGYRYAASGIGPIEYSWNTTLLASNFTNQTSLYENAGWFIPDNTAYHNGQAPEAVESWYYAYQVTGDQYWRDVAWAYTLAQNRTERVGSGFSSVNDVLVESGNGTQNFMASYMLAEVLKYEYLIQKPFGGMYDVEFGKGNENSFVYNTEAHPFRVRAKEPV